MEVFPGPQNDNFVKIDDNLSTECNSNDVDVILNNYRSKWNHSKTNAD